MSRRNLFHSHFTANGTFTYLVSCFRAGRFLNDRPAFDSMSFCTRVGYTGAISTYRAFASCACRIVVAAVSGIANRTSTGMCCFICCPFAPCMRAGCRNGLGLGRAAHRAGEFLRARHAAVCFVYDNTFAPFMSACGIISTQRALAALSFRIVAAAVSCIANRTNTGMCCIICCPFAP